MGIDQRLLSWLLLVCIFYHHDILPSTTTSATPPLPAAAAANMLAAPTNAYTYDAYLLGLLAAASCCRLVIPLDPSLMK